MSGYYIVTPLTHFVLLPKEFQRQKNFPEKGWSHLQVLWIFEIKNILKIKGPDRKVDVETHGPKKNWHKRLHIFKEVKYIVN